MDIRKSVVLRIAVSTFILGSGAFIYFAKNARDEAFYISVILASVYFLSLVYLLLESFLAEINTGFKYFQIIADVILSSILIYITGTTTSPFIFLYPLLIIFSSIFVSKSASYFITGVICISYLMAVVIGHAEITGIDGLKGFVLSDLVRGENGLFVVYFHLIGFLLISFLGGYLSERISITREELGESKKTLDILKNLHEDILQSLGSGVMTLDFEGSIITINNAGMKITGLENKDDIVGRNINELFNVDNVEDLLEKQREEIKYYTRDGRELIFGLSVSMLKDSRGDNHGYNIVFQDLTDIRELEQKVRNTEKLALLGQLSGGFAHEIRNPLSVISGAIEILAADIDENDDYYRLINVASREIERLNLIVEDFLLLTVPVKNYKVNTVDISSVINETADTFAAAVKRKDIMLEKELGTELFTDANAYRLKQVFWNLLSNSVDAMPDGGEIFIKCFRANKKIETIISDQGQGIEDKFLTRVFDPFFTTKDVGTGLGLAIVQKIVEGYGGYVTVSSQKGKGTNVTVTLPFAENTHIQ